MDEKLKNILDKMDDIKYGWVDKYHQIHHHSKKKYFIDNYRFMSIEDTLKYSVGTCFEQTALVSHYLNQNNIDNKTYIIIYNDPDKIARHTVCIAYLNNSYYLMESSWFINNEQYKYDTIEEILRKIVKLYPKMYKIDDFNKELIEIYEYDNPRVGVGYEEFFSHAREGNKININL